VIYNVSITSQGQMSVPAKIRRELGLDKETKALVSVENGKMVVEPVKDLLELRGSLKTNKKPLSDREMDEVIAQAFADEYAESVKRNK
jgi:AbrB family looped-hinge helix DNA binding protein